MKTIQQPEVRMVRFQPTDIIRTSGESDSPKAQLNAMSHETVIWE